MSVVVAVYVLRELVSRPVVAAHLGHECNHILRLVSHEGSLHQMATWSSQNSIAGCRAVDFVQLFDLPSYTQFAAVDVDTLPHLLFMLFSVAVLTVTGLFPDVGDLIIFCPLFPLMFALVSFTPVTSLPVTMVTAFLFCFLVVFLHSSILNCGVFLHSFPFCTCADSPVTTITFLKSIFVFKDPNCLLF